MHQRIKKNGRKESKWTHIFGEANFVVDALATIEHFIENLHTWEVCITNKTYNAFLFDCIETECTKFFYLNKAVL